MKILVAMFFSMFFVVSAHAQKAYDCSGEKTYGLAQDIVKRTVEGASQLSVVDLGVEQTSIVVGEGGEADVEKWHVQVNYKLDGQAKYGQSFEITYVVSVNPDTLQAKCQFRSAEETWTE